MTSSDSYKALNGPDFRRTYRDLKKSFKSKREAERFESLLLEDVLNNILDNPRKIRGHTDSALRKLEPEPYPSKMGGDANNDYWKAYFRLDWESGARKEGRLMYIIHDLERVVTLLLVYTHADYSKRPDDTYLKTVFKDAGIPRGKPEVDTDPS